jgi:hypothetical protein
LEEGTVKYLFMRDYKEYKAGDVIEIESTDEAQRLYLATGGYLQALPPDYKFDPAKPPADRMQRRQKAR